MKKQELIEALRRMAMGRLDAIETIADLLMPEPEPQVQPIKPAHGKAK